MFTQQAPSLVRALRDVLTPEQLEQLTTSLGNCQQPLAHRGPVHLAPPASLGRNQRGVYGPGAWDPARHPGLVPAAGNSGLYEIGGMHPPVWNSGNRYASGFNFPTEQFFALNNYLGGPQVYINNSNIENITNQNLQGGTASFNSVAVLNFNGQRLPGFAGPPGAPGREGLPGAPGDDGADGLIPDGDFRPLRYLAGNRPRARVRPQQIPGRVTDIWVIPTVQQEVPTDILVIPAIEQEVATDVFVIPSDQVVVPTAVSFNQESCDVTIGATTTITVAADSASSSISLLALQGAGQPIAPVTIAGISTATIAVAAASDAASTSLSALQGAGQPIAPVTIAGVATTTIAVAAASTAASTRLSALQRAGQPFGPVTIAGVAFGNPVPITARILGVRVEEARVFQE